MKKGFSLIEILVVIALFAMIGVVVSQSTAVSLQGTRKADASSKVRENLNQALGVMERQIRAAKRIESACSVSGSESSTITYTDQDGVSGRVFNCVNTGACSASPNSYIASSSGMATLVNITSPSTVCITECKFVCTQPANGTPPTVDISITGESKDVRGVENTIIKVQTSVNLRTY